MNNLKNEVRVLLLNTQSDQHVVFSEENAACRYCRTIHVLLKKENPVRVNEFIVAYAKLLNRDRMPLLNMQLILLLFEKWLIHPMIFEDLELLLKKLPRKKINEILLGRFIRKTAQDKVNRSTQISRINLLAHCIRSGMIREDEFTKYGIVIDAVLKLSIHPDDHRILNIGFNKVENHFYRSLFFVIRNLIDKGTDQLELAEIIERHFSPPDRTLKWTESFKCFFELLDNQLPADYLLYLNRIEIRKLYFLYSYQPELFKNLYWDISRELSLKELVRLLFSNFMISGVFLEAYCDDAMNEHEKVWFVDELTGRNIIYSNLLPLKLTKKAAHFFRCMTEGIGLSVSRSLIFAQVFTLTNNEQFARALAFCIRNLNQTDFWIETLHCLFKKGLESGDVQEVMDYINDQVFIHGVSMELKYKSLENLKREIEAWHVQLSTQKILRSIGKKKLPEANIKEFIVLDEDVVYCIKQVALTNELYEEGEELKHCVYSYRKYCMRRETYIFSMRRLEMNKREVRLITIELDYNHTIRQIKGKHNRAATDYEKMMISMWAEENRLACAS